MQQIYIHEYNKNDTLINLYICMCMFAHIIKKNYKKDRAAQII